jgi:hypothetical protein
MKFLFKTTIMIQILSLIEYMFFIKTKAKEISFTEAYEAFQESIESSFDGKHNPRQRFEELRAIYTVFAILAFSISLFALPVLFFDSGEKELYPILTVILAISISVMTFALYLCIRSLPAGLFHERTERKKWKTGKKDKNVKAKPHHVYYNIDFILGFLLSLLMGFWFCYSIIPQYATPYL